MNRKFSRLLSAVLAMVMMFSCVVFSNVSIAMAAISTGSIDSSTTTVWDLLGATDSTTSVTGTGSSSDTIACVINAAGYKVTSAYSSGNTGVAFTADDSKGAKLNSSTSLSYYIAVPAKAGDVIYAYVYGNTSSTTYQNIVMCLSAAYDATYYSVASSTRGDVQEVSFTVPESFEGDTVYLSPSSAALDGNSGGNTNFAAVARVRSASSESGSTTTTEAQTEVSTEEVTEVTSEEATEETTEAVTVEFKVTFDVAELETETVTEVVYSSDNNFKIIPKASTDSGNDMRIDAQSRKLNLANGTSITSTNRINTQASGSKDGRAVSFTTGNSDGQVYVYALSGSSSGTTRSLTLYNDSTEGTQNSYTDSGAYLSLPGDSSTEADEIVFNVEANTTYYLYSTGGGAYIYYIGSTVDLVAFEEESTTATETETESVTETETESASETTTESTDDGYVAMGSYDLNSSTVISKDMTYANMVFSSIADLESDHIRLKNTSSITFKVAEACTLTVTVSSNNLTITGGEYTSYVIDKNDSPVTLTLAADTEYVISGETSSNARLSNLTFAAITATTGTISGAVTYTDLDGETSAASGVTVNYVSSDDTVEGSVVTDSKGAYTIEDLEAGTYTVSVDATSGYEGASYSVDVTAGSDTAQDFTLAAKDDTTYTVTFSVTNNSGNANTIIIKAADTGDTVDDSTVTFDESASATADVELEAGDYTIELYNKTLGQISSDKSFTVNGDTTVNVTVAARVDNLTALTAGTTYEFGSSSISASNDNFDIVCTGAVSSSNIKLMTGDSVTFKIGADNTTVTIVTSSKDTTIVSADGATSYDLSSGTNTLVLSAGNWIINGASGTGVALKTITVAEITSYTDVTLSGTNNTGADVEVTVTGSNGSTATFTAASGSFSTILDELVVGATYTLTVPSGSYVSSGSSFTAEEGTDVTGVVIDTDTRITVPVTLTGNTSKVSITINGTSYSFAADEGDGTTVYFEGVEVGNTFTFKFANNVANKIVGWEGINPDEYDKTNTCFVGTATEEGFAFTYNADAMTTVGDTYGTGNGTLALGNYGYGATKGSTTGAKQAEETDAIKSVSGVLTLRDYVLGYRSTDARLLLNNSTDTYVQFTASQDGYVIIDVADPGATVTIDGTTATSETIGDTGKSGFTVTAGAVVKITSASTSSDKSAHLKSIRYQTDGNVFAVESDTAVYSGSDLDSTTLSTLGASGSDSIIRVIGSLDTSEVVDTDSITAVGVLIITDAKIREFIADSSSFIPANFVDQSTTLSSAGYIVIKETDSLYDAVYDISGSTDEDGEYEIGTGDWSDGIYYMLRFVKADAGTYYILPFTNTSSGTSFDDASYTADDLVNLTSVTVD